MRLPLVILLLAVAAPVFAAEPDAAAVDRIFSAFDKPASPGCALGVIRDGNFIYRHAYGLASLELAVPLSSESVFYVGSVSKQFTAASLLIAAHRGLLSLDDDVRKYIPELPDYGHPITLRHMLNHTSGLRDVLELLIVSGRNPADVHTFAELLDLVTRQKALNFTPGDQFLYSNTNYFLLAEIVRRVSKQPLSRFAQENIFQPLHMTHTRFYDDRSVVVPGRVPAYGPGPNGQFTVNWSTNYETVGNGGLMSSVDDLLQWDRNFYADKLAGGSVAGALQVQGRLNNGKEIAYALGLQLMDYRGLTIVEHSGAFFGYSAELLRFPQQRFSVICLCNLATADSSALALKVADLYLEKEFRKPALSAEPAKAPRGRSSFRKRANEPIRFAGTYEDDVHSAMTFTTVDGQLALSGPTTRVLDPTKPGRFTLGDNSIEFETNRRSGVTSVKVLRNGDVIFKGMRIVLAQPDEAQLAALTGRYHSDELDADVTLAVEQGKLVLRHKWMEPSPGDPLAKDEFRVGSVVLVFHRDSADHVTGYTVFGGRSRGMQFTRS